MQGISLILALVAVASPRIPSSSEVTATRLDGGVVSGELREWTDAQVVLATLEGEQRLATEDLVSLRWSKSAPASAIEPKSPCSIALLDGTLLPAAGFEVSGAIASVEFDGPLLPGHKSQRFPVRQLAAVQLQVLEPSAKEHWDEIRSQKLTSDLLALLSEDGKSVDYMEGVIRDVSANKIGFEVDGTAVRVNRAKVAGLIYYRKNARAQFEPKCVVHGQSGLRATAGRLQPDGEVVRITTAGGVELLWPLVDIVFLDFSLGKIVYLSDLEPGSQQWTPLLTLPPDATLAAEYGKPRRDQSGLGGPLKIRVQGMQDTAQISDRSFNKGLAIRSRSELVYRLPSGFGQFVALAGIDAASRTTGNVQLTILGDDRSLFDAEIPGDQPPREIKLDIADVKRLKIVVDFGENLDTGDWLNLCEARLLK